MGRILIALLIFTAGCSLREFKPHSLKQDEALFSVKPITLVCTGIQWGKTTLGCMRLKMAMHTYRDPSDNFLLVAPNYKIMSQSSLPEFLRVMDGYGEYSKADACFRMYGAGTCYMRTGTEPDSIVGVTNVRHILGDEAGKFSLYFWDNIQGRAAFKRAPITLTTSPYSLNWVYKDLIKGYHRGKRPDIHLCQARSDENPYFPQDTLEQRRASMSPQRFNAMFGGQFEKMEGLVYDCFSEDENICEPFELPTGTRYVAGVDWGTSHPFALMVRAITPSGYHFNVSRTYKTGLSITDMVDVAKRKKEIWGVDYFYCDPAQPGYIAEFNKAGLAASGARNDVRVGIDLHYELVKTRRYKVFEGEDKGFGYLIDEYDAYHWPEDEDKLPNQNKIERNPVKQDDHAMDAERYATISTYNSHTKNTPINITSAKKEKVPQTIRLEQLKKNRRKVSERWS